MWVSELLSGFTERLCGSVNCCLCSGSGYVGQWTAVCVHGAAMWVSGLLSVFMERLCGSVDCFLCSQNVQIDASYIGSKKVPKFQ
jgi:hypothetical protein